MPLDCGFDQNLQEERKIGAHCVGLKDTSDIQIVLMFLGQYVEEYIYTVSSNVFFS